MHKWRRRNDAEQLSDTVLGDMRSHFQDSSVKQFF